MNVFSIRTGLAALAISASAASYGAPLVNNLPNQAYGTNMSFAQVADNFTIAGTGTYSITSIDFWSLQLTPGDYRGSVSWTIFNAEPGGSIGTTHSAGVASLSLPSAGGGPFFGYTEYEFNIPVAINLTAGDGYWLALHNGSLTLDIDATEMLWEWSATGDAPVGRYNDLGDNLDPGWIDTDSQHAFRLIGTRDGDPPPPPNDVPEPSTLALLFGALAVATRLRRPSHKV